MIQDGSLGHQGTDASNGSAPTATRTATSLISPGENSNNESWTGVPVAEDAGRGKDVVEPGSAGSSHSSAGVLAKGKRSAAELVADDTDEDNVSKGKGKVIALDGNGGWKKQPAHKLTERARRMRMKNMFGDLHALLPRVPEKADRATIIGEAVSFIRVLESTVAKLEKRKQHLALARRAAANFAPASSSPPNAALGTPVPSDRDLTQGWAWLPKQEEQKPAAAPPVAFQSWSGTNAVLTVSEDDALISVCAPRHAGVLVLSVLQKHRLDVVTTQVASDEGRSMFNIHARVNTEAIQKLDGEPPASEDIYRLAVSEIIVRLST